MPNDPVVNTMNLGQVLGAVMADLTRARSLADQETLRIAQLYAQDPLLRDMPVPHIRLPEITLDMPILIQRLEGGRPSQAELPEPLVHRYIAPALEAGLRATPVDLSDSPFLANFAVELNSQLDPIYDRAPKDSSYPDAVVQMVLRVFAGALSRADWRPPRLDDSQRANMDALLERTAREHAWVEPGAAPTLGVLVTSREIKELGTPTSVTRIKVTLKEEGLEWKRVEATDGSSRSRLLPE
jgi:hypothetical protein